MSAVAEDRDAEKRELDAWLAEREYRHRFQRFDLFYRDTGPLRRALYPKHVEFFKAGAKYVERIAEGGNRSGKSEGLGGYETTCHLTGQYPDWWEGWRVSKPISARACGKTGEVVRDSVQSKLLGFPKAPDGGQGEVGTGLIPKDRINLDKSIRAGGGVSNLFDTVVIHHGPQGSGGESTIQFRSYARGRDSFEAVELDWCWEDEEAPEDIHAENLMRLMTTNGRSINTFTPLKGRTPLVIALENRAGRGEAYLTRIAWDDCPHITPEMISEMIKRYPKHELDARRYGIPKLGSGAIFTMSWDEVSTPPVRLQPHWPRSYGLDFGWTHPTAAVWLCTNRDQNITYVYSEHRRSEAKPGEHALAIRARGEWLRGAADTNANVSDGKKLIDIYRGLGLHVVPADKSLWAGIESLREAFVEGGLKFFDTLPMCRDEYNSYHTDEKGKVTDLGDDLMDALRYGWMSHKQLGRIPPRSEPRTNVTTPDFGNLF